MELVLYCIPLFCLLAASENPILVIFDRDESRNVFIKQPILFFGDFEYPIKKFTLRALGLVWFLQAEFWYDLLTNHYFVLKNFFRASIICWVISEKQASFNPGETTSCVLNFIKIFMWSTKVFEVSSSTGFVSSIVALIQFLWLNWV